MKIPVIINNRDLLTWPKAMIDKIRTYDNVGEIIIIDNESTYPPLLEWYKTNPCIVIFKENLSHYAPWTSGILNDLQCEYYVATDSDLGLESTPADTLMYLQSKLENNPILHKVGLGLDWKLVKEESPYYNHVNGYEKNRWENSPIDDDIYIGVAIDTTFAIYKIEDKDYFIGGGSLSFPYVAKHYPWYYTHEQRDADSEFSNYIRNASYASSYKRFLGL